MLRCKSGMRYESRGGEAGILELGFCYETAQLRLHDV